MLIVRTVERWLRPVFIAYSVFLLLRGHNGPGGGFVGGLVAAAPFALHALVHDAASVRRLLRIDTQHLMGLGLLVAMTSGLVSLAGGQPFLTGRWIEWQLPGTGWEIVLGTPLLFDFGVYLAVMGVTLTIVLALAEED